MQEYTPAGSSTAMKDIATFARLAASASGLTAPIANEVTIEIVAYFEIPKYRRKELHIGEPHGQKPDLDNILKTALDGIKKGLVIVDDCQVSHIVARKEWSDSSRLEVTIDTTTMARTAGSR
jgi:Holliday junction resolvase RusA-like endonuclease